MLLQLAIDNPRHFAVVPAVIEFVDIVEVGTPVLKRFGLAGVATLRELAEGRPILADSKTVDGGADEARMLFGAGATFMTVLEVASSATHAAVNRVAGECQGFIMVDSICSAELPDRPSQYPDRFAYLTLHTATDVRLAGGSAAASIQQARSMRELGYHVALAGGLNRHTLIEAVQAGPDIVVVGSAITTADNPAEVARWMSSQLTDRGRGWPPSMSSPRSPRT